MRYFLYQQCNCNYLGLLPFCSINYQDIEKHIFVESRIKVLSSDKHFQILIHVNFLWRKQYLNDIIWGPQWVLKQIKWHCSQTAVSLLTKCIYWLAKERRRKRRRRRKKERKEDTIQTFNRFRFALKIIAITTADWGRLYTCTSICTFRYEH